MNGVERSNDGVKYKGIDLEKIKQVQEVKFPHVSLIPEMVQLDLKKTFSLDNSKNNDSVIDAIRLQIEAHQNKQREDTEMFIICEMAKLFLEEKQKQKNVLERLEAEFKHAEEEKEKCVMNCLPYFDRNVGYATGIYNAIEFIKEWMG